MTAQLCPSGAPCWDTHCAHRAAAAVTRPNPTNDGSDGPHGKTETENVREAFGPIDGFLNWATWGHLGVRW